MADDMIPQDAEEMLDQAADAVADVAEVEDTEQLAAEVDQVDERIEAAVRHVAEEAEADIQAAQAEVVAEVEEQVEPVAEVVEEQVAAEPERKKRERRSKQARAAKAESSVAEVAAPAAAKPSLMDKLGALGGGAWIAICCVSLLAGLAIGHFALGGGVGGSSMHVSDVVNVEESQLENAYATYTYNGKTETVTIQDVIDGSGSASDYANEDGTYKLPSAEIALSVARNEIVQSEMDARGITASDEDLEGFAEERLGMTDFEAIANAYGVDVDTLKDQLSSAYRLELLRKEVIDVEAPTQPTQPTSPEEGKEEEATKEYATYILDLAGDEWNSKKEKWVDKSSPYATALADYDIKNDSATYKAAQDAYYVAYQNYATAQSEYNDQWTAYVNGLMVNASVEIGTLVM